MRTDFFKGKRVLIIDDKIETSDIEELKLLIVENGIDPDDIVCVLRPEKGIELGKDKKNRFDLIIIDYKFDNNPLINGVQVAQEIKKFNPEPTRFLLSAYATDIKIINSYIGCVDAVYPKDESRVSLGNKSTSLPEFEMLEYIELAFKKSAERNRLFTDDELKKERKYLDALEFIAIHKPLNRKAYQLSEISIGVELLIGYSDVLKISYDAKNGFTISNETNTTDFHHLLSDLSKKLKKGFNNLKEIMDAGIEETKKDVEKHYTGQEPSLREKISNPKPVWLKQSNTNMLLNDICEKMEKKQGKKKYEIPNANHNGIINKFKIYDREMTEISNDEAKRFKQLIFENPCLWLNAKKMTPLAPSSGGNSKKRGFLQDIGYVQKDCP